jgi:hypothetical protein
MLHYRRVQHHGRMPSASILSGTAGKIAKPSMRLRCCFSSIEMTKLQVFSERKVSPMQQMHGSGSCTFFGIKKYSAGTYCTGGLIFWTQDVWTLRWTQPGRPQQTDVSPKLCLGDSSLSVVPQIVPPSLLLLRFSKSVRMSCIFEGFSV